MKIDWDKESGGWNIRSIENDTLLHRVAAVRLQVPSELVTTDGGRHGYLVTAGQVTIKNNVAIVTKG